MNLKTICLSLIAIMLFMVKYCHVQASDGPVPIQKGTAKVIAIEGLSLRAKPSLEADVLLVMPFGAIVNVVDTSKARLDSLPALLDWNTYPGATEARKVLRVGYWVTVTYQGKKGYALDIFLLHPSELFSPKSYQRDLDLEGLNEDFVILKPEAMCINNLADNPHFNWYGLYAIGEATCQLRPIRLRQHVLRIQSGPYLFVSLCSYADANKHLMLIFGTKQPLQKNMQSELVFWNRWNDGLDKQEFTQLGFEYVVDDNSSFPRHCVTWYRKGGISQEIDPPTGAPDYDPRLRFAADVDGDGKRDYCMEYGDETGCTVLYLSRYARKGELLRPVAIYFTAYCC